MALKSSKYHIDLNEHSNPNCKKCCNREERKELEEDTLCSYLVSVADGLPIRCVGEWGYEKIYRLVQYFNIFTKGMKNKWAGRLNYIEICSGPGRNIFRKNGE